MKIKILIPVFNDWQSLSKLMNNIDNEIQNINHEISIIIVDDASNFYNHGLKNKNYVDDTILFILWRFCSLSF